MPGSILGNSVRRVEDPELLRGHGTFVDNLRVPGAAHAVFVRSPFAHARLTGIDTSAAAAAPEVLGVFTAQTLGRLGSTPVPAFMDVPGISRHALTGDRARYVGDPVALVVARTRAAAVDAAELVDVDYDPLPVVTDMEAALAPGAPAQFEGLAGNIARGVRDADDSDPFEGADTVVRLRMENQRIAVAPIEGNAIMVVPADGGAGLTVHVATQHPHLTRDMVCRWTGLAQESVRVVAPHVGGAFGGKAGIGPQHAAVIAAALELGVPVGWTETRSEAMLSMHGRGQVQYAELGLTSAGEIVGLRLRVVGDCGAYAGFGGTFATGSTYLMAEGPYRIPQLRYDGIAALTNTTPNGAFRGAGRPEAAAMLERLMDFAADELGLAPEELRRRNLLAPDAFPHTTHTGATYDVADFDLPLREALRLADVDALRAEQQRRRDAGEVRQLGIGIAVYVEITGFGGSEFGSVRIDADGGATVRAGTSAHGQGHATSFAMIVSDRLGIPTDRIRYVQSDTAEVPSGGGTGGSRSLQMGGNAVGQAAGEVLDQARELAARMLEVDVVDVVLADGRFGVAGVPDVGVGWEQLAAFAAEQGTDLGSDTSYHQDGATFPFGAHVAVVEVDTETGRVHPLRLVAVDDCGTVLNPLIVQGQQHGGAVQGVSQALWEQFVYDADGNPITSTFADYAIPTTADTFALEVSSTETPTPVNPLGAKGIGESATIGSTPAVQNAVVDAVRHLGVRHVDLPCTPERVWRAISAARAGTPAPVWREPPAAFATLPRRGAEHDDEEQAEI